MKPLYLKALFVAACSLAPLAETAAYDLAKETRMKNWLEDNHLFVESQFRNLELPFEVNFNSQVAYYIEQYLRPGRRETERLLGKAAYYFPVFERALQNEGLPGWLKYLPIVESGLQADIESPVGAVGLWQFMPATADFFNLRVDEQIDERSDPYRSSEAAAQFLNYLYREFGDWSLALAAYNCGPGNVKRAIRREGSDSYELIKKHLPGQTKRYITKLKAVAYVAAYHEFFGLKAEPDKHLRGVVAVITLNYSISFEEIARRARLPVATIKAFNPAYLQNRVNGKKDMMAVVLPAMAAERWKAAEEEERRELQQQQTGTAKAQFEIPTPLKASPKAYSKPVNTDRVRPAELAGTGTFPQPKDPADDREVRKAVLILLQRQELQIF